MSALADARQGFRQRPPKQNHTADRRNGMRAKAMEIAAGILGDDSEEQIMQAQSRRRKEVGPKAT